MGAKAGRTWLSLIRICCLFLGTACNQETRYFMWTWGVETFIWEKNRSTCKFSFLQAFLLCFWRKRKGSSLFINTINYSISCASVCLMLRWGGELVLARLLGRIIWGCWWIGIQGGLDPVGSVRTQSWDTHILLSAFPKYTARCLHFIHKGLVCLFVFDGVSL